MKLGWNWHRGEVGRLKSEWDRLAKTRESEVADLKLKLSKATESNEKLEATVADLTRRLQESQTELTCVSERVTELSSRPSLPLTQSPAVADSALRAQKEIALLQEELRTTNAENDRLQRLSENLQVLKDQMWERASKVQQSQTALRTELSQRHGEETETLRKEIVKLEREKNQWRDLATMPHLERSPERHSLPDRWSVLVLEHKSSDLVEGFVSHRGKRVQQLLETLDLAQNRHPDIVDTSMRNTLSRIVLGHCFRSPGVVVCLDAVVSAFERNTGKVFQFSLQFPLRETTPSSFDLSSLSSSSSSPPPSPPLSFHSVVTPVDPILR